MPFSKCRKQNNYFMWWWPPKLLRCFCNSPTLYVIYIWNRRKCFRISINPILYTDVRIHYTWGKLLTCSRTFVNRHYCDYFISLGAEGRCLSLHHLCSEMDSKDIFFLLLHYLPSLIRFDMNNSLSTRTAVDHITCTFWGVELFFP